MLPLVIPCMPTPVTPNYQNISCGSGTYADHTIGLPESHKFLSLPRLKLVQSRIRRSYRESGKAPKMTLPNTPPILSRLKMHWLAKSSDQDIIMLWAAVTLCLYGFFRAGKITVPSLTTLMAKATSVGVT